MPLNIRSEEVNALADQLAGRRRITKTEAVRQALAETLRRDDEAIPLIEKLNAIAKQFAKYPKTGLQADKAFFDELSGDI